MKDKKIEKESKGERIFFAGEFLQLECRLKEGEVGSVEGERTALSEGQGERSVTRAGRGEMRGISI